MMSPIDDQSWGGGCIEVPGGKVYTPNVPTEEVFTVPHKYKVNGVVCSTMPLNFRGKIVDDFRLVLRTARWWSIRRPWAKTSSRASSRPTRAPATSARWRWWIRDRPLPGRRDFLQHAV